MKSMEFKFGNNDTPWMSDPWDEFRQLLDELCEKEIGYYIEASFDDSIIAHTAQTIVSQYQSKNHIKDRGFTLKTRRYKKDKRIIFIVKASLSDGS